MQERSKVVEIKGTKWRIDKVNALDGSSLIRKFVSTGKMDPQDFLSSMPDEQFNSIQAILLKNVFELQEVSGQIAAVPILLPANVVAGKASDDPLLIFSLTVVALSFNLKSFLSENALKEFQEVEQIIKALN